MPAVVVFGCWRRKERGQSVCRGCRSFTCSRRCSSSLCMESRFVGYVWNRGLWVTDALVGARFRCLVRPFLDPETLDAMWITHSSFFTIRRRMSNQLALQLCACRVVVGVDKALIISLAMRFKASPHACIGVMLLAASCLTVSHPPMSFAAASHTRFTMTVTNSLKRPGRVLANC